MNSRREHLAARYFALRHAEANAQRRHAKAATRDLFYFTSDGLYSAVAVRKRYHGAHCIYSLHYFGRDALPA